MAEFRDQVSRGHIGTCAPVVMELLYSARSHHEFERMRQDYGVLVSCPIGPREWERAIDIYAALSGRGAMHQRQVGHADLLIAVAAESAGVPVLHYGGDFDLITEVAGIDTRWVRPQGSLG